MRAEDWPKWLLAGLAAILVAVSLWSTGGLAAARAERRDDLRYSDLNRITAALRCVAETRATLPKTLDELGQDRPDPCQDGGRLNDPFTGEPYAYQTLSQERFRLCAGFEQPERLAGYGYENESFDPAMGCIEATAPSSAEQAG